MSSCVQYLIVCFYAVCQVHVLNYVVSKGDGGLSQEVPKEMSRYQCHPVNFYVRHFCPITVRGRNATVLYASVRRRFIQILRTGQVTIRTVVVHRTIFRGQFLVREKWFTLVSSRLIP